MGSKALLAATEPRIVTPENKQLGILSWDSDNNYPARMRIILANSVTSVNCHRVYSRFVMGRGLADETFAKAIVNPDGDTADRVVRRLVKDKGFINAVACHVTYNGLFEKVAVKNIPIENVRFAIDKDKIAVHPNWEKRKDKKRFNAKEIEFFWPYSTDPEVIQSQIDQDGGLENYRGQVFYWSPNGLEYTVCEWDASAEDAQTEAGTKIFRHRTVTQNFLPSQYIIVDDIETSDEDTKGNNDESFADVITATVKQFQSPENAAAVMIIQKPSPETTFQLEVPDLQHFDGMYEKTESSTENALLRGWMMPRPLILEGGDSLFTSGEVLRAASEFYISITEDDRLELNEIILELFSNWEENICPSEDYSVLPLTIQKKIEEPYFPYFTKNEIRESVGGAPVEEQDAEKKMLVETISVGGTQALVAILTDVNLSDDQKKGILKKLFNFSDEEVTLVMGSNMQNNDGTNHSR